MGIKKLFLVFMLLFSTSALADDLFDNSWGDNEEEDSLKYNALENKWNYADEDDSLKYNALENEWDYAGEDDTLRYNALENKWDYGIRSISTSFLMGSSILLTLHYGIVVGLF